MRIEKRENPLAMTHPRLSVRPLEWGGMVVASSLLIAASYFHWWSIGFTEALGFATGGVCVWLTVREHIGNWPVGLANNVIFFVLFNQTKLYADMWLQVVYFGLGVYGWHQWLRGGERGGPARISMAPMHECVIVGVSVPVATAIMYGVLVAAGGAAPIWDALTTALCLAAQALLIRKRLLHWLLWIVADIIYIPLYLSRNLPLTALLYSVFLGMCIVGLRAWFREYMSQIIQPQEG